MKNIKCLSMVLIILVSGCNSTGGTIGDLFPAPKFLKGDIKFSRYTSADKKFSVWVPHDEASYEFKYLNIKEQYTDTGAYVSFGPAAYVQSIYRLEVGYKLTTESKNISVEEYAPKLIESYKQQLFNSYGTQLELFKADEVEINGKKSLHYKFKQNIPVGKHFNNKSTTFTHEAFILDHPTMSALVWVQIPNEDNYSPGEGSGLSADLFAKSFEVIAQQGVQN